MPFELRTEIGKTGEIFFPPITSCHQKTSESIQKMPPCGLRCMPSGCDEVRKAIAQTFINVLYKLGAEFREQADRVKVS
ncbi:hypothetical protein KSZ_47280 [Dictyobacter formicarum]|uniref:Uncharacterized protein n=1 Tax=Dictyobacter formicarum TaxID=2778368 RepID=A0ABQ3VLE8_9CHLR|nr:hypothetical protein KSZ_47280 [Dictyobacter formicarum]